MFQCTSQQCSSVLANSVPISAPDNYNEVDLHPAETIDSTIDQFKDLIKKARKFIEDIDFTDNNTAHSTSKKKFKKLTHGRNLRISGLKMGYSILSQIHEDKLCKKVIALSKFDVSKMPNLIIFTITLFFI